MKTWDQAIKQALYMYVHRNQYAYFYGAKGQVLTDGVMNALIDAYPQHFGQYTMDELNVIKDFSRGKIGFDCSGFVEYCTGTPGSSAMQIHNCHNVTSDLVKGPAGSLLYKQGHIGLDVGFGMYVHMPHEGDSIIFGKILEYNWTQTGQSNYLNYEGSDNR